MNSRRSSCKRKYKDYDPQSVTFLDVYRDQIQKCWRERDFATMALYVSELSSYQLSEQEVFNKMLFTTDSYNILKESLREDSAQGPILDIIANLMYQGDEYIEFFAKNNFFTHLLATKQMIHEKCIYKVCVILAKYIFHCDEFKTSLTTRDVEFFLTNMINNSTDFEVCRCTLELFQVLHNTPLDTDLLIEIFNVSMTSLVDECQRLNNEKSFNLVNDFIDILDTYQDEPLYLDHAQNYDYAKALQQYLTFCLDRFIYNEKKLPLEPRFIRQITKALYLLGNGVGPLTLLDINSSISPNFLYDAEEITNAVYFVVANYLDANSNAVNDILGSEFVASSLNLLETQSNRIKMEILVFFSILSTKTDVYLQLFVQNKIDTLLIETFYAFESDTNPFILRGIVELLKQRIRRYGTERTRKDVNINLLLDIASDFSLAKNSCVTKSLEELGSILRDLTGRSHK